MGIMGVHGESSVSFGMVGPGLLDLVWDRVEDLIIEYHGGILRFIDLDSIYNFLKEEKIELWLGMRDKEIELGCLTQVCGTVQPYVEVFWVGGKNFKEYYPIGIDALDRWGAGINAKHIVVGGRPGWSRRLEREGFRFHRIELIRPISYMVVDGNTERIQ